MKHASIVIVQLGMFLVGFTLTGAQERSTIRKEVFGTLADGSVIHCYALRNSHGMEARIIDYGGIVVSLLVPDRSGRLGDVVLGFDSLSAYVKDNPYFGCLVGRYGNRIAKGQFAIDGTSYVLATNNGANHLHGGVKGYDKVVWEAKEHRTGDGPSLELRYRSRDGEEGYPGTLSAAVIYKVSEKNELIIRYQATTDKPTVVNLTHHSYFNLAGSGTILGHELMINADRFTPVDSGLIPTGELRSVHGTPMDFTTSMAIGARIGDEDDQLRRAGGYDHNFVLNRKAAGLTLAARLTERSSGRTMEVLTTEPGLQFYSGNFLDGHHIGKAGQRYQHRYGLCLETQHFPDSPNQPNFPSTLLKPGGTYISTTIYRFGVAQKR